jgi:uncharacterized protein (DUF427 family)
MKALWNNQVIAESDDTLVVEGNHYFPRDSVNTSLLKASEKTSYCSWKGVANYYTLAVNGEENKDAAWFYADPKKAARDIAGRIAFWRGVDVVE